MMNRLMVWCIPDEALRWGRLTGWWSESLAETAARYLLTRYGKQFDLNAQEPPPK